jgi:UDPglucose 6-dehydrogenase
VRAHDPTVRPPVEDHRAAILASIELVAEPLDAATGAQVLVVATEWPDYADLDLDKLAEVMVGPRAVVDTRNLLDAAAVRAAGLRYEGVGRGAPR